jgi:predicted alpha/beta-fold hydrolase
MTTATVSVPTVARPFIPRRWLENGHAMTVFAWARTRLFPELPPAEARLIQVTPDTQVLAHCFWQPSRAGKPTLLALHGLEGSSDAHYMRGLAHEAWARGWNAVLLNQRNCGGTEHLTPGLYHSGLTADPRTVIATLTSQERLGPFGVVGYSLGGNLTLKLAGELVDFPDLPVKAVVAVSPTMELDVCVHAIERRSNIPYEFNFVRNLKARMRRKVAAWPGSFDLAPLGRVWTIRQFDEVYTAPHHGFKNALDYYTRASAMRVVDRIPIPALILTAADDPFVPASQFSDPAIQRNPHVVARVERHGGHCGFVETRDGQTAYWAETTAVQFLAEAMGA